MKLKLTKPIKHLFKLRYGTNAKAKYYYLSNGLAHLSFGLACGLAGLSSGMGIRIVVDVVLGSKDEDTNDVTTLKEFTLEQLKNATYGFAVKNIVTESAGHGAPHFFVLLQSCSVSRCVRIVCMFCSLFCLMWLNEYLLLDF